MTLPLEHYVAHADDLADRVVKHGSGAFETLPPEFIDLFHKGRDYKRAKELSENHRQFGMLTAKDEDEERGTRLAFAKAYKALDDSAPPRPPEEQAILDIWQTIRATNQ